MKFLFALMFVSLTLSVKAQSATGEDLRFEEVVKTDSSLTKHQLYLKTLEFFTDNFRSSKDVIQLQDAESGIVVGKLVFTTSIGNDISYTTGFLKISTKDGRIKYEIYNFKNDFYGIIKDGEWEDHGLGKGMRKNIYKDLQDKSKEQSQTLTANIHTFFSKIKSTKNEW